MELPTLKDYDLEDKKVLLRVDINSPIDPRSGEILDTFRFKCHIPTIEALNDAKVVILAHQSRPGLEDFTTLEKHAHKLEELLNREVEYVDDIFGSLARKRISSLENGDILLLENVRFCSEEISENVTKKKPKEQANTIFVRKLSKCVDFFINDAFAVSHRPQPSVVAFPTILPCCAGLLLEKEVKMLSSIFETETSPRVFLFGGAKVKDSLKVIRRLIRNGLAEHILVAGVVANTFLKAKGISLGEENEKNLKKEDVELARKILNEKIKIPIDVAYLENGERKESKVEEMGKKKRKILDIGKETIEYFSSIIREAGLVVANGPCGVYEMEAFALGTKQIAKAIANSKATTILGGGHLAAIVRSLGIAERFTFISTGGKACLLFLAGEKLPGIEVLKR